MLASSASRSCHAAVMSNALLSFACVAIPALMLALTDVFNQLGSFVRCHADHPSLNLPTI